MKSWQKQLCLLAIIGYASPVLGATVDELNLQAIQQMRAGQNEAAEKLWRQVIESPDSTHEQKQGAKNNLSVLYHKIGKETEANALEIELGLKKTTTTNTIESKPANSLLEPVKDSKKSSTVLPPVAIHSVKAAPVQAPKSSSQALGKDGDVGQSGSGYGNNGGDIASRLSGGGRVAGNIAPYRNDQLTRVAASCRNLLAKQTKQPIFQIQIGKDGQLLSCTVVECSDKKAYKEIQAAIEATEFAPLPEWYYGAVLTFKIDLAKVEQLQQ